MLKIIHLKNELFVKYLNTCFEFKNVLLICFYEIQNLLTLQTVI